MAVFFLRVYNGCAYEALCAAICHCAQKHGTKRRTPQQTRTNAAHKKKQNRHTRVCQARLHRRVHASRTSLPAAARGSGFFPGRNRGHTMPHDLHREKSDMAHCLVVDILTEIKHKPHMYSKRGATDGELAPAAPPRKRHQKGPPSVVSPTPRSSPDV